MWLLAGSIIAGAISAYGSWRGAQQQNAAAQASVQQQEAYQTQMSNTAYQRAQADMAAAGINPILLGAGQPSESTPSGSTYSPVSELGAATSSFASTAMDVANIGSTINSIENTQADTALKRQYLDANLPSSQQFVNMSSAFNLNYKSHLLDLDVPEATNESKFYSSSFGQTAQRAHLTLGMGGVSSALKLAFDSFGE